MSQNASIESINTTCRQTATNDEGALHMRKNRMLSVANAAAVLALVSGPAMATSCTSTFALTSSQILSLLNPSGNQSCIVSACSGAGTNTWQQLGSPDDNET